MTEVLALDVSICMKEGQSKGKKLQRLTQNFEVQDSVYRSVPEYQGEEQMRWKPAQASSHLLSKP